LTKSRKSRNTADPGNSYVGRFAPSPTGPLHLGSLICALASYLDARAARGRWLVRIEDIDPPREVPGAAEAILAALRDHGLQWDGDVLWQSTRTPVYQRTVEALLDNGRAYRCDCSRKDVANMGGIYDGRCRHRKLGPDSSAAVRLNVAELPAIQVQDAVQPDLHCKLAREVGDFVILRRDGLFAYQLAVVVDDDCQGITRVVRGSDLFDSTPKQIALQQVLGLPQPDYAHIPVIENDAGQKLSKQSHAPALDANRALENLELALRFLGQALPGERVADTDALLRWAVAHWDLSSVPRCSGIPASSLGC